MADWVVPEDEPWNNKDKIVGRSKVKVKVKQKDTFT